MARRSGEGVFLSARQLSEQGRLVEVFSREFGLVRGLMRGRHSGATMAGDTVRFEHVRRLENQLGTLTCEVVVSRAAYTLTDMTAPLVVAYLAEVSHALLPEDHPYPELYAALQGLWQGETAWWRRVAEMERVLLTSIGYGLSLAADAVPCESGTPLRYVSPVSGRAVSAAKGAPYAGRLLVLPAIWGGEGCDEALDMRRALRLTGSFMERACHGKPLVSRGRLLNGLGVGVESGFSLPEVPQVLAG